MLVARDMAFILQQRRYEGLFELCRAGLTRFEDLPAGRVAATRLCCSAALLVRAQRRQEELLSRLCAGMKAREIGGVFQRQRPQTDVSDIVAGVSQSFTGPLMMLLDAALKILRVGADHRGDQTAEWHLVGIRRATTMALHIAADHTLTEEGEKLAYGVGILASTAELLLDHALDPSKFSLGQELPQFSQLCRLLDGKSCQVDQQLEQLLWWTHLRAALLKLQADIDGRLSALTVAMYPI